MTKNGYAKELKAYLKKAEIRAEYSIKRFDILIITLSSGGLVLALNLYKTFLNNDDFNLVLISYAWISFSIAILSNLLSQVTGLSANKFDISATEEIIESTDNETDLNLSCNDCYKEVFNILTKVLNVLSFIGLFIAITLLTIFIN